MTEIGGLNMIMFGCCQPKLSWHAESIMPCSLVPFAFIASRVISGVQMRATHLQQCAVLQAELARLTDSPAKAMVATRLKWLEALQQHQDWAVTLVPDVAVASRWAQAALQLVT